MKKNNHVKFHSEAILEELESRQLFSGGIEGILAENNEPEAAVHMEMPVEPELVETPESIAATTADSIRQELVFIDTDVDNYQELLNDIIHQDDEERNIEVILLDNDSDGIEQITEALADFQNLDAVHLISHGSDGSVDIGNTTLDAETLNYNLLEISSWSDAFTEDGDFLIYGCNLAATEDGQSLVESLSTLTLTDVAASDDLTGTTTLAGDWDLEYKTGDIESTIALSAEVQQSFSQTLSSAPQIDLDSNDSSGVSGTGFSTTWTKNGGAVAITDVDAILTDADSVNMSSMTITITNLFDGSNEKLSLNIPFASGINAFTNNLTRVVTLGSGSVTDYQQILRTFTYDNLSETPDTTARIITFVVNDGTNSSMVATATVNMNVYAVSAITDTNGAIEGVAENASLGDTVGITALATDADGTDSVTYSLSDDAGGLFAIDTNTGIVTVNAALDAETTTSHNITVLATSTDTSTSSQSYTISITDIDEFDVITPIDNDGSTNTVAENAATNTIVGITALASDADQSNNTITYSLDNDAGGRFQINSSTGVISVANGTLLNAENATSHSITIKATSSDSSFATELFSIAVTDVDEFDVGAVTDTNGSTNTLAENAIVGDTVGITASASDADLTTNTISYSLSDNAGGLFSIDDDAGDLVSIDANTGIVIVVSPLDFETSTTHNITVLATSDDTSISASNNEEVTVEHTKQQPESVTVIQMKTGAEQQTSLHFEDLKTIEIELNYELSDFELTFDNNNENIWKNIDLMRNQMDAEKDLLDQQDVEIEFVAGAAVGMTAGFISWVLHSGALLSSLLSSASLLKQFDPLAVVFKDTKKAGKAKQTNQKNKQDTVESMFDKNSKK
jgi:hypothetical protein